MPLGIQRLNAKRSQPNDRIVFIKPLKGPDEEIAREFLERIAAQCLPIMRDHNLSVMSLEEYEPNAEFVGRNFNAGEVIQLVLKARFTGHWLPFNYVQMVMMHELAHCKQMNHSRAFWAVRNQYAEQMRRLWARGFTGEGLWGRGALLATGEFEKNTVEPGELLPEHLCGGTRSVAFSKKFGANGVTLGEDTEAKRKLEKGRTVAAKPRVAGSARGRELRAAAALARFEQQKQEDIAGREQVKDENDEGSETESGDDYDEDIKSEPDALDLDGKKLLDSKGRGMVRVCEDENPEDHDAQQELRELQSFGSRQSAANPPNLILEEGRGEAPATPQVTANRQAKLADQNTTKQKSRMSNHPPLSQSSSPVPTPCPVCSFANEQLSATCAMCANVLDLKRIPDAWACRSKTCHGTDYRNAGDCGVCGVCGERR
ncbi:DNA-dependent metalloprotease WSS1 [Madurella mycetomatis]|uniref:DNA-dependent metalloprotease WSS1 n=1 Tax=Madurella mycetomatis TaxID=100816 RepID=A0A175W3F3_9PEZI|nr:DNA-dependent metalloprotease WSS1 [Madurella mycetomatis]